MDTAQATLKFIRTSPRKLRLIADTIRGAETQSALSQLSFIHKRATKPLIKAIKQVESNAKQTNLLPPYLIHQLTIDKGPIYKRWQPVSRGRAHSIHKHTSHINIVITSQPTGISTPKTAEKPQKDEKKEKTTPKSPKTNKKDTKPTKKSPSQSLGKLKNLVKPKPATQKSPRVTSPRTTSK
jgi:large subunit ribosomal protein L22